MTWQAKARELDAADPLRHFADRFRVPDPELRYLDEASLGRPPAATADALARFVDQEWAGRLVRGWDSWIDLPQRLGDRLGAGMLGAAPGQVVYSDSVTVNLYKLAMAALRYSEGRRAMITDDQNFATDRYVAQGIEALGHAELRTVEAHPDTGVDLESLADLLDEDVAIVVLSLVDYRSGALLDMARVNALAREAGALVLWDLSHATGAVPIALDATGADLAVGCSYKYLCGGPGAPAFLYARRDLQPELRQPIWGWFGQREQFAMGPAYDPVPGIERFLCGTPSILGLAAVEPSLDLLLEAGIDRVREKSMLLTEFVIDLVAAYAPYLRLASPREAGSRGAHVTFEHPEARAVVAGLAERGVIVDYLGPNRIRLAPGALSTSFEQVWDAVRQFPPSTQIRGRT
jgi:kynureninase